MKKEGYDSRTYAGTCRPGSTAIDMRFFFCCHLKQNFFAQSGEGVPASANEIQLVWRACSFAIADEDILQRGGGGEQAAQETNNDILFKSLIVRCRIITACARESGGGAAEGEAKKFDFYFVLCHRYYRLCRRHQLEKKRVVG